MKTSAAVATGKLISFLSKKLGKGGGSAAPGLYALKLEQDLVTKLASQIPQNIIITGTNGKTTTARLLAHFAQSQNLKVIRNSTGSNLERGVASALISQTNLLTGKLNKFDLGVWELDEAAFNDLAPKLKPEMIIFLNIFRDQLDRYGEVDSIVKKWTNTLKQISKKATILINGDDQNLFQLQEGFSGQITSFGVEGIKITGEYVSPKKVVPHKLDYQATQIQSEGLQGIYFQLLNQDFFLPVPGLYHVYDAVAAIICAHQLGFPLNQLNAALKSFSPAFGRVEKLPFGYIFLIKNPAGATAVFQTLAPNIKKDDRLLLALNDNLADGTDVSWIWDGEFEKLVKPNIKVLVSGTRAYDLALRLKYAGFNSKQLTIEPNLNQAFLKARAGLKGTLFILPTYTAMLELQNLLAKQGLKKNYWEEI